MGNSSCFFSLSFTPSSPCGMSVFAFLKNGWSERGGELGGRVGEQKYPIWPPHCVADNIRTPLYEWQNLEEVCSLANVTQPLNGRPAVTTTLALPISTVAPVPRSQALILQRVPSPASSCVVAWAWKVVRKCAWNSLEEKIGESRFYFLFNFFLLNFFYFFINI